MNKPSLVHCPNCKNKEQTITLGSVTSEGYFITKSEAGHKVLLMAQSYSIICDCGYYIRLTDGKITADALSSLVPNG